MEMENGYDSYDNYQPESEDCNSPERKKRKSLQFRLSNHNESNIDANSNTSFSEPSINKSGKQREMAKAWNGKNYDHVLQLLEQDAEFPKDFKIKDIYNNVDGKRLKKFVQERNTLHKLINQNDVEKIKKIECLEKGHLHLNMKNQSACYVALKFESFNVYAYLISVKAEFKNEEESKALRDLSLEKHQILEQIISRMSSSSKDKHVDYLVSCSRSRGPKKTNFKEEVKKIFKNLNEIPEILTTLQVLQYTTYLEINFDFDRVTVDCAPRATNLRGYTKSEEGIIHVAAGTDSKRKMNKVLGTTAHECTHMALEIVFGNTTYPNKNSDKDTEKRYHDIMTKIKNLNQTFEGENSKDNLVPPLEILKGVFKSYKKVSDHPSELIVIVPQLLAEDEKYREKLNKDFPDLMAFYREIIEKFKAFVESGPTVALKKNIKDFNKFEGEIDNLANMNIFFKDVEDQDFLNLDGGNVFIIEAESSKLTMLRTLQKLYSKNFSELSDSIIVLKFDKFLSSINRLIDCLNKTTSVETVLVEIDSSDITDVDVNTAANHVSEIFRRREKLKIVMIVPKNEEKMLKRLSDCEGCIISKVVDEHFSLNDLDDDSVGIILKKRFLFQDQEIMLNDLIVRNEDLFNMLSIKSMDKICSEREIKIGGRVSGTSNLEGAYTDVIEKINLDAFCSKIETSDNSTMFIINGLVGEQRDVHLCEILKDKFSRTINFKDLCEEYQLKSFSEQKILFTNYELSNEKFKGFCHVNPNKKIYLINLTYLLKDGNGKLTFILKKYYNPNFYSERKFKRKTINKARSEVIKADENAIFIISNAKVQSDEGPNVHYLEGEDAIKKFEELSDENKTVHWISQENNLLIWKNSNGPVEKLEVLNSRTLKIGENEFIEEIGNKRVVLISDEPGMGKSTSVTKLYEKKIGGISLSEKNWLIRINLRDHLERIKSIDVDDFDDKKLIGFLADVDKNLNDDLNQNFLNLAIFSKSFRKPLLIVFDGFDEILDETQRKNVKFLLTYLKDNTRCKIWISTRLNFKEELENELSTFAVEFQPIDDTCKRIFIKNYLNHRLDLILLESQIKIKQNKSLNNFTNNLIVTLKSIFTKDSEKFIGTPLQLYLILGISVKSYENYVKNLAPGHLFLGNNVIDVYSKFLEMKYDVYFKKINLDVEPLKEVCKNFFNEFNKNLAESIIFPYEGFSDFFKYEELMLATGVIKFIGGNVEFIHFTFREHYSAEVILEYLKNTRQNKKLNFNIVDILMKNIFLQPEYKLVRQFLNLHLEKDLTEIPEDNLKRIGEVIALLWGNHPSVKDKKGTVLHVALEEKNESNFKFLICCCKTSFSKDQLYNLFVSMNSLSHTIFHVAANSGDQNLFQIFLSEIKSLNLDQTVYKELLLYKFKSSTPLDLAKKKPESGICKMIEFELTKLEKNQSL